MLAYAFSSLKTDDFKSIETEKFNNISELLATILNKSVNLLIKRGFFKSYKEEEFCSSNIRGKINISKSIARKSFLKKRVFFVSDIFTENIKLNQIIKTTLFNLVNSDITNKLKNELKNSLKYFENVDFLNLKNVRWTFKYDRNNNFYEMIMTVCELIYRNLLQTEVPGKYKTVQYIDESSLPKLYEKFVLQFYKKEVHQVKTNASQISWNLDNDYSYMLPRMRSDITIEYKDKVLIIDTKFYVKSNQEYYSKKTYHSNNLYQIFTYVKNKQSELNKNNIKKDVIGVLLYAQTDVNDINNSYYYMSGNKVGVCTLNLNENFENIKKSLFKLLKENLC